MQNLLAWVCLRHSGFYGEKKCGLFFDGTDFPQTQLGINSSGMWRRQKVKLIPRTFWLEIPSLHPWGGFHYPEWQPSCHKNPQNRAPLPISPHISTALHFWNYFRYSELHSISGRLWLQLCNCLPEGWPLKMKPFQVLQALTEIHPVGCQRFFSKFVFFCILRDSTVLSRLAAKQPKGAFDFRSGLQSSWLWWKGV